MQTRKWSLLDYARAYDALAKSLYGFKKVEYPRNMKTYAMDPRTKTLYAIVPEAIPAIPQELRINFVQAGVAHEAGHLENGTSLTKALTKVQDKDYLDGRNAKFMKDLHNILIDVSHERCIGEKFLQDQVHLYTMWSNIEDNMWRLEKLASVTTKGKDEKDPEDGDDNPELTKELNDFNNLWHYLALTQRDIVPHCEEAELPERYKPRWNEIEDRVCSVLHATFDSIKVLDASKVWYDIIVQESPALHEQLKKNKGMKIKVIRIKGIPEGMSLPGGGGIDLSEFDPEDVEIEEMEWEDYLDSLGKSREEFMGKMVKNQNDDDKDKSMEKDSRSFEFDEDGKPRKGKSCKSDNSRRPNSTRKPHDDDQFDPPMHEGSGRKCVVVDYDLELTGTSDPEGYQEAKTALQDMNRLRTLLQKKLVHLSKDRMLRDQTVGRLDPRRLSRIPLLRGMPEKPVHKKIIRSRSFKKVVCSLLIDESGSMGSSKKYFHARCAAVLFAEVLESLKIKNEVIGFSTDWNNGRDMPACCNRHEPLRHIVYKNFAQKLRKDLLGSITARDNNADGESLLFTAMRIAKQTADRRIIFVFSDGYPQCSCDYDMQEDLRSTIQLCLNNHIEIIGIGICSDAVKQFYPDNVVIDDASDLTQEFYRKLDELLSRQK